MYLCRYHEVEVLLSFQRSFPPQPNISFYNLDALETTYTTGSTRIHTVSQAKSSTPTVESLRAANTLSIMYLLVHYILQEQMANIQRYVCDKTGADMTISEYQELGSFPFLKQWKIAQNYHSKNSEKFKYGQPNLVIGVFEHAEFKFGLNLGQLSYSMVFGYFFVQRHAILTDSVNCQVSVGKNRRTDFQEYMPLLQHNACGKSMAPKTPNNIPVPICKFNTVFVSISCTIHAQISRIVSYMFQGLDNTNKYIQILE